VEPQLDHNPNLKPWKRPSPNQVAGKGKIESPGDVVNIVHQTRSSSPTEYENRMGEALMEIFDDDISQLSDIVAKLNELGVKSPDGELWTEDNFELEMRRLGA
jgi:hypothetical protein